MWTNSQNVYIIKTHLCVCVKKEKYINSLVQCAAGPLQSFTNLFMMVVGLSRVGLSPHPETKTP